MMGGFGGMGGWGMGFGWIGAVLVVGLIVWAVVGAVGWRPGDHGGFNARPGDESLRILKERYARGELDADSYHRMREELEV